MKKIAWIGILSLVLLSNAIFGSKRQMIREGLPVISDSTHVKGWRKTHHGIKPTKKPSDQSPPSANQSVPATNQSTTTTNEPVHRLTPAMVAKRKSTANRDTLKN